MLIASQPSLLSSLTKIINSFLPHLQLLFYFEENDKISIITQLIVTPSGANQAITVTDVSKNNALQYLEYDAATRTISTRGQYTGRDATILVEWNGGSKQFTIPVQLYAQD